MESVRSCGKARRWWAVLALAGVLSFASTAVARTPPAPPAWGMPRLPLGVDVGWVTDNSGNLLLTPERAALVARAGAGLARVEFRTAPFFLAGTQPGSCSMSASYCALVRPSGWQAFFAAYDQVVANLRQQHVQVLGLLDYTTVAGGQQAWVAGNAEHGLGTGANAYTAKFARYAAKIMTHFAGSIRYWEIWNEPNAWTQNPAPGVYAGGSFMYPSNFAALLAATYRLAVQRDHLPVRLISGGLFGQSIGGNYTPGRAGATYLQQVFAAWRREGVHPYPLSAVGQHLYISQHGPVTAGELRSYLRWVHQVPVAFGAPQLPTVVTEIGWTSAETSSAIKAENLALALRLLRAQPYVVGAVVFNLMDGPGMSYGIYSAEGIPTAAWGAFHAAAGAWRPHRAGEVS
jgi:hypothetical protein